METIKGRVYKFGDDVNTDVIYPGKYLSITTDRQEMARHCFEAAHPEFMINARPGDIVVGGRNFGCGSSREQAVTCLLYFGIAVVVAESFARIFYRNAINLGLPVVIAPGITPLVGQGDIIEISMDEGFVKNARTGALVRSTKLPIFIMETINDGGLVKHLQKRLGIRKHCGG